MNKLNKKRLLYIAYFYPPLGGPGVQRPIKTIKYLSLKGWVVDVLTVNDIQFHSYDYKLLDESKADNIYRTSSLDVMSIYKKIIKVISKFKTSNDNPKNRKNIDKVYFKTPEKFKKIIRGIFPIDDKIGWLPYAYLKAIDLCRRKRYDAIFATMGPYTSGLLALKIHNKLNIPFFIDYRDHWTLNAYPQYSLSLLKKKAQMYEKLLLRKSLGVSVVGSLMKDKLCQYFGQDLKNKIEVVYNGYDEDDFTFSTHLHTTDKKIIRYVGNFYGYRTVNYFIKALCILLKNNQLPENIIFEFVGNYYIESLNELNKQQLKQFINVIPQVNHKKAVDLIQSADALLLFIPSINSDDVIPGKIFEYMRAKKPILSMIPANGEPAMILRQAGHKYFCAMEDVDSIVNNLKCLISSLSVEVEQDLGFNDEVINNFSRENQSYKLEKFISKQFESLNKIV
ncbi:MAG: glycosyltransferase [Candidatus Cloacimonetes bacterium]|nr:glycosyltransferase [Candidatus Cloacimonadota bacterium]